MISDIIEAEKIHRAPGIVVQGTLKIEPQDIVLRGPWDNSLISSLNINFSQISHIWFHDVSVYQAHPYMNPISIRGRTKHGDQLDVVLLGAPAEVFQIIYQSADAAGNGQLKTILWDLMLKKKMFKSEPVYDRLIIRRFGIE